MESIQEEGTEVMNRAEEVKEFSESLKSFFIVFDGLFLHSENAEELLTETRESLKEKILRNESALPAIMAMGGNYDSDIDNAKVEELNALLGLLKSRQHLRQATIQKEQKNDTNQELLSRMFGI